MRCVAPILTWRPILLCRHMSSEMLSLENEIATVLKENAADKEWARGPDARHVLSAGAKTEFPVEGLNEPNMDAFLLRRGFKDAASDKNPSAHRTLTAALTFPLTLAYGISRIFDANRTGHYIKREVGLRGPELHTASDLVKDQSY